MSTAHPGFTAAAASIERKEGVSKESADAILAAGARHASAKAKRANPRLEKVSHAHEHPSVRPALAKHEAKKVATRKAQMRGMR